jgi:hypothetical protein
MKIPAQLHPVGERYLNRSEPGKSWRVVSQDNRLFFFFLALGSTMTKSRLDTFAVGDMESPEDVEAAHREAARFVADLGLEFDPKKFPEAVL